MPSVDFVICTFNNREIIAETLRCIECQTVRDFTCTIVDDCSTDGTPEFIRKGFPWVKIFVKPANTGPAESRNIGLALGQAPYVVLLDSDVRLDPHWAEAQISFLESDYAIAMAGGKLVDAEVPDRLYGCYGVMNRFGVAWNGGEGERVELFSRPLQCLWINTTAIILRRDVLQDLGDFDAAMFSLGEDCDLGWRANLFGYKVFFNPAALAAHQFHSTFKPSLVRRLIYLVRRNRIRSVVTNYEFNSLVRYVLAYLILSLADGLIVPPRKEKLAALWWNIGCLRDTLRRRRWVQRRRILHDRELWPMFTTGIRGPGYFQERARYK